MRKLTTNCILNQATRLIICIPILLTTHVETVALLSKLDVDKHISIKIELDELDLTSVESKATYAQIKEYIY